MGIELSVIWFVIIVFATLMYIVMDGASACCSARCGAAGIAT